MNHSLQENVFIRSDFAHPTLLPRIVGGVKFARVIKIDSGNVLDRIRQQMRVLVRGTILHNCVHIHLAASRDAITFAAVAPAPTAPLIVGASGFATSPMPKTLFTLVC